MGDKQFELGLNRQGHPAPNAAWRKKTVTADNLPFPMQMGEESSTKRTMNELLEFEMIWQHLVATMIILACQPKTHAIASYNLDVLAAHAGPVVERRVRESLSRLLPGKHPTQWITTRTILNLLKLPPKLIITLS